MGPLRMGLSLVPVQGPKLPSGQAMVLSAGRVVGPKTTLKTLPSASETE